MTKKGDQWPVSHLRRRHVAREALRWGDAFDAHSCGDHHEAVLQCLKDLAMLWCPQSSSREKLGL